MSHNPEFAASKPVVGLANRLARHGTHSEELVRETEDLAFRLQKLASEHPGDYLERFLCEEPRWADRNRRLTALRTIELANGAHMAAIERPGWVTPTMGRSHRPLSPAELATVRLAAQLRSPNTNRRARDIVTVEIGTRASATECAAIEASDAIPGEQFRIVLHGTGRPNDRRHRAPRTMLLPERHNHHLERLRRLAIPHVLHRCQGPSPDLVGRTSTVTVAIKQVLKYAGLGDDPTVAFESIGLGAARQIATDPLGFDGNTGARAAAAWLGLSDLGHVAAACALLTDDHDTRNTASLCAA